ncbi:hypothetical protein [Nocardioides marmoribigeumensis]|uniref:hypothetical protein n=1 Tax=Nocardioides marmoribigeumensis TaxID=433649 RepID=UPI0035B50060
MAPVIGDNVNLWQGAKILGQVQIGDNVEIGANAVVIHDVPTGGRVVAPLGRLLDPERGDSGSAANDAVRKW